jgi:hypothetical protein
VVIVEGQNAALQYLVEKGADINVHAQHKRSPIFCSVEYNNHFALNFLHQMGAQFGGSSEDFPSIAHIAAYHADIETLRILTSFQLILRDVECVDSQGLSIPQIVDKRLKGSLDSEEGLIETFNNFLEECAD